MPKPQKAINAPKRPRQLVFRQILRRAKGVAPEKKFLEATKRASLRTTESPQWDLFAAGFKKHCSQNPKLRQEITMLLYTKAVQAPKLKQLGIKAREAKTAGYNCFDLLMGGAFDFNELHAAFGPRELRIATVKLFGILGHKEYPGAPGNLKALGYNVEFIVQAAPRITDEQLQKLGFTNGEITAYKLQQKTRERIHNRSIGPVGELD